jgi:hypothetical protein
MKNYVGQSAEDAKYDILIILAEYFPMTEFDVRVFKDGYCEVYSSDHIDPRELDMVLSEKGYHCNHNYN